MSKNIKPEDVNLYCRCCLNKLAGGRYCTGFRIWQKGLYPELMCEACHELLRSFESFEKKCKESSGILEELLNGQKIEHEAIKTANNDETTTASVSNRTSSDTNILTSIPKYADRSKDDFSFEKIDVKPEVESERNLIDDQHEDTDIEDSLALAELDDAEVKSEASSVDAHKQHRREKISQDDTFSKRQMKSLLNCEMCKAVFTTTLKLKQHVKKVHHNEFKRNSTEKPSIREASEFESSNSHDKTQSSNMPTDETEAPSSTGSTNNIDFENIIVQPKLEDLDAEAHQSSDSDFEDSLALTELRKTAEKRKTKKPVKRKRKSSPTSPSHSVNETFGPLKAEKPKVECDKCPRKFKWPFELRRHIKEMHGDKPLELPCKYDCGKIFNSQNTLKSHYRIKHQMKKQVYRENAYICEQCGKGFKRLPLLERHRFHHLPPEARPFKCEQCGKTFVMERIYKEHLLRHSGNKKYECSYCGIKKATLGEYREHINIHTKEKEYACELCPKIFYRSKNLVQHVSAVHQGIKKHFCRFCQHSFANHINLVHHERIHTGEKPYSCEICKRSFIQPSALKTHMKTHDETRVKAKVGRKPKNNKAKEEFDFEAIMDDNLQQQMNNYNE